MNSFEAVCRWLSWLQKVIISIYYCASPPQKFIYIKLWYVVFYFARCFCFILNSYFFCNEESVLWIDFINFCVYCISNKFKTMCYFEMCMLTQICDLCCMELPFYVFSPSLRKYANFWQNIYSICFKPAQLTNLIQFV